MAQGPPQDESYTPPPMTWDEVMNYVTNDKNAHFPDVPEVDTVEVEGEIL